MRSSRPMATQTVSPSTATSVGSRATSNVPPSSPPRALEREHDQRRADEGEQERDHGGAGCPRRALAHRLRRGGAVELIARPASACRQPGRGDGGVDDRVGPLIAGMPALRVGVQRGRAAVVVAPADVDPRSSTSSSPIRSFTVSHGMARRRRLVAPSPCRPARRRRSDRPPDDSGTTRASSRIAAASGGRPSSKARSRPRRPNAAGSRRARSRGGRRRTAVVEAGAAGRRQRHQAGYARLDLDHGEAGARRPRHQPPVQDAEPGRQPQRRRAPDGVRGGDHEPGARVDDRARSCARAGPRCGRRWPPRRARAVGRRGGGRDRDPVASGPSRRAAAARTMAIAIRQRGARCDSIPGRKASGRHVAGVTRYGR